MTNCVITNNQATTTTFGRGGGVDVDSNTGPGMISDPSAGTVTFTGCTFSKNTCHDEGGGLLLHADVHNVNLTNDTFGGAMASDGNQSTTSSGGGLVIQHSFGGTVTMTNGSIQNNTAVDSGGVIIGFNTSASLSSATISNNTASTGNGGGVTIAPTGVAGFTPTISPSSCTISGNHADAGTNTRGGGVYFNSPYSASFSNCTISSNVADEGGGVFNGGSTATPAATLTIDGASTTISNNTANGRGGGVSNVDSSGAVTILNGITIDSNTAGSGRDGIDQTHAASDTGSTGSTFTLQGTINVNGGDSVVLGQTSGTFTSTSGTLNITGNFTRTAGTFTHNSGTVVFNGSGAQSLGTLSTTFNNLTVNKSGGTLTLGGNAPGGR